MHNIGSKKVVSGRITRGHDEPAVDAERFVPDADQGTSDADQSASDSDQTASDADQVAAQRDEADSASDQRAAEQDQASADRQQTLDAGRNRETYEASRSARAASTIRRLATHLARASTARSRVETAADRDATAAARDDTARRRDAQDAAKDRAIAASDLPAAKKLEYMRTRAAEARARAAADREKAAEDRAAAAAERIRLEAELTSAHLDDLTRAYRRDVGSLALSHEIERARRGDGRFVVAFVDVDGLKRVNDRKGHAAGDEVLKALVSAIRSHLRPFDPVVRFGGDEFLCGLGGTEVAEVERRFELIDRAVRKAAGIGISVGLASLLEGETLDQLTARADAALLRAKRRRRYRRLGPGG